MDPIERKGQGVLNFRLHLGPQLGTVCFRSTESPSCAQATFHSRMNEDISGGLSIGNRGFSTDKSLKMWPLPHFVVIQAEVQSFPIRGIKPSKIIITISPTNLGSLTGRES